MSTREQSSDFLPQGWLLRGTLVLDSLHDRNPPSNAAETGKAQVWVQAGLVLGMHKQGDTAQVPVASPVLVCWALHQQDPGLALGVVRCQSTSSPWA